MATETEVSASPAQSELWDLIKRFREETREASKEQTASADENGIGSVEASYWHGRVSGWADARDLLERFILGQPLVDPDAPDAKDIEDFDDMPF